METVLSSGAVQLLDSDWLIRLSEAGGVLAPRQALPPEAFLSLDEVKALTESMPRESSSKLIISNYS